MDMQRFDDRRIIITGAGSGIGQATVARLLDEGGLVVACDVSSDGLEVTAAAADFTAAAAWLRCAAPAAVGSAAPSPAAVES